MVGETQAHVGDRFYYIGPQTECKECKLKGVCFNLEAGRQYEIKSLRDTHHECEFHEGGVRVVEVEKIPTKACVPRKLAIDGSVITLGDNDCARLGCTYWNECHPVGLKAGDKLTVTDVIKKIECPNDIDLVLVKLGD